MAAVNVAEASAKLGEWILRAQAGEEIVFSSEDGTPMARLQPLNLNEQYTTKRLGLLAHTGLVVPDSFFDPLPEEELRAWEGESL